MLKGGHEAPTKPKGRPKKNSIPTTEEIEAEERRMKLEEEEKMIRAAGDEELAHGGETSQLEAQDVSSEMCSSAVAMEECEREPPLLMQPETHAVS